MCNDLSTFCEVEHDKDNQFRWNMYFYKTKLWIMDTDVRTVTRNNTVELVHDEKQF
jgi:hypothetical protein